jgi:hypothetical protein
VVLIIIDQDICVALLEVLDLVVVPPLTCSGTTRQCLLKARPSLSSSSTKWNQIFKELGIASRLAEG